MRNDLKCVLDKDLESDLDRDLDKDLDGYLTVLTRYAGILAAKTI